MTISSATTRIGFAGSGTTGPFTITNLEIQDESQLLLTKTDSSGTETTLVLTTDYTVNTALTEVTTVAAVASGSSLTATLNVPLTQGTDYKNTSALNSETVEDALDKLTLLHKQQIEELDRAVRVNIGTSLTLPIEITGDPIDNQVLAWDTTTGKFVWSTLSSGTFIGNQLTADLDCNAYNIQFDDADGITDDSGNEQLIFQKTASAVNHFEMTNAATGNAPILGAAGGDANVDITITPKGTGSINFSSFTKWSKGADVASAAALPVLTDGNYFDVTGTTTITSINTIGGVGSVIKLHFDGALTLTHHATNLILPGGANITTAAGDEAEFVEYGTGTYRCTSYTKADGTAVVGGGSGVWTEISRQTASSDATIDFTGLDTTYKFHRVIIDHLTQDTATSVNLRMRVSDNGVFFSGASDYGYNIWYSGTSTFTVADDRDIDYILLHDAWYDSYTNGTNGGEVILHGVGGTNPIYGFSRMIGHADDPYPHYSNYVVRKTSPTVFDGIRFYMASGNIKTGTFILQGMN